MQLEYHLHIGEVICRIWYESLSPSPVLVLFGLYLKMYWPNFRLDLLSWLFVLPQMKHQAKALLSAADSYPSPSHQELLEFLRSLSAETFFSLICISCSMPASSYLKTKYCKQERKKCGPGWLNFAMILLHLHLHLAVDKLRIHFWLGKGSKL